MNAITHQNMQNLEHFNSSCVKFDEYRSGMTLGFQKVVVVCPDALLRSNHSQNKKSHCLCVTGFVSTSSSLLWKFSY